MSKTIQVTLIRATENMNLWMYSNLFWIHPGPESFIKIEWVIKKSYKKNYFEEIPTRH